MKLNLEHPVLQFIQTTCEFICLNILFLLCCLPIITIGSAISSLYQVTMKEARKEHGYFMKPFMKAFISNFKESTAVFLVYLLVGLLLLFNLVFWTSMKTIPAMCVTAVMGIASVVLFVSLLYTFPLIARFQNSIGQTLKNSILIALVHKKTTGILILIHALIVLALLVIPQAKTFMVLFGFAFFAYCNSFFFNKVFEGYHTDTANS